MIDGSYTEGRHFMQDKSLLLHLTACKLLVSQTHCSLYHLFPIFQTEH